MSTVYVSKVIPYSRVEFENNPGQQLCSVHRSDLTNAGPLRVINQITNIRFTCDSGTIVSELLNVRKNN